MMKWLASLTSKLTRVSSSLIGCLIQSALYHIEAKSFVNYYINDKEVTKKSFKKIIQVKNCSVKSLLSTNIYQLK